MSKDPLLTTEFYSVHRLSISEVNLAHQNSDEMDKLIKQQLYPHLQDQEQPIYYQNSHTLAELNKFVYLSSGSYVYTQNFITLQNELKIIISKIKNWTEMNKLDHSESLNGFLKKLEQPSDAMSLLYSDGKRILEKIAIFLDNPDILLIERQKIMVNLLADKELEHCIAGCYSRVASAALQLEANLENNYQIKHWLRSFAKDVASVIAAKRPFAVPDSYQVLVCKASQNSAVTQNMLHAHNYLLFQAKEYGFPIAIDRDPGAVELEHKLSQFSKLAIINAYTKELEKKITANNLVDYLTEKLHENFNTIMLSNHDYRDKVAIILNKLNLIGEDNWFKKNKVGLEEIFDENNQLRSKEHLKITVTQRLIARKILTVYESKRLTLSQGNELEYYGFASAIELTWVWANGERKLLLQLIREDSLSSLIPIPNRIKQDLFPRFTNSFIPTVVLLLHALFITNTKSLLTIIKNIPSRYHQYILDDRFSIRLESLNKKSQSVQLFIELLRNIPDKSNRKLFIENCGVEFIHTMIANGLAQADVRSAFPGLSISYSTENFDTISKNEGLSITKELLKLLVDNGFKDFSSINFKQLPFRYLDWINFSTINFKNTKFYQFIQHSNFDEAILEGAIFYSFLNGVSFRKVDLRKTDFQCPKDQQYSELYLTDSRLSTDTFKKFRLANILNFSGANLKEIDFQRSDIKNKLRFLNLSGANLEGCNLKQLSLVGLKIQGANLVNVDLRKTTIDLLSINQHTNIQDSQLEVSKVKYIHQQGFKNFDGCKIDLDIDFLDDGYERINFYRTQFKNAEFFGESFYANFVESDLSGSIFRSDDEQQSKLFLSLRTIKSKLDGVHFKHVNFIENTRFKFYLLNQVTFEQVEMSAKILFEFYEAGHLDFSGVKSIKGPIPKKLSVYPVWNAKLPKNVFLDLFRLGLRNFRGSDLNSFYLGQVLTEQAISEVNLRLDFAQYKYSPLGCGSGRSKRQTNIFPCSAHVLLQNPSNKNQNIINLEDIEVLARSPVHNIVIKETLMTQKPLFQFDNVDEAHFYLGYRPDTEEVYKTVMFAVNSLSAERRNDIKLRIYLAKPMSNSDNLMIEVQYLKNLGFSDIVFHYFNLKKNYFSLSLKNGAISTVAGTNSIFNIQFTQNRIIRKIINHNDKVYRILLRRISMNVKKKIGAGRLTGRSNGAQYDLGAMILFFIAEALNKPKGTEVRPISELSKLKLKELVPDLAKELGESRGASAEQIQTAVNIAYRCVDQGQCSTEELLITDIIDSMYRMRPDLEIGNDYARKKIVEFFVDTGNFLATKFTEIKLELEKVTSEHTAPRMASLIANSGSNHTHIETQPNWHDQPVLLQFINKLKSAFINFGVDLERDIEFYKLNLVENLNKLCLDLTKYEHSNVIPAENITFFLQEKGYLQENARDIEQINPNDIDILNDEDDYVNDFIQNNQNFNATKINQHHNNRSKRALDAIEKKLNLHDEQIWIIADHFLVKHEQKSQHRKSKNLLHKNAQNRQKKQLEKKFLTKSQPVNLAYKINKSKQILHNTYKSAISVPPQKIILHRSNQFNGAFKLVKNQTLWVNHLPEPKKLNPSLESQPHNKMFADKKANRIAYHNSPKLTGSPNRMDKSIKALTAHSDLNTALFFLDYCIKNFTKKNYTSLCKKQMVLQERVERKMDKLQRKLYR